MADKWEKLKNHKSASYNNLVIALHTTSSSFLPFLLFEMGLLALFLQGHISLVYISICYDADDFLQTHMCYVEMSDEILTFLVLV